MAREQPRGMRYLSKFLIAVFLVYGVVGCAPPIGTIGGSAEYDRLRALPKRFVYDVRDLFRRDADLEVEAIYHGSTQLIPVAEVAISVIENPDLDNVEEPVSYDAHYIFQTSGRKMIVVRHGSLEARYSIDVRDDLGPGGGGNGNGNNGQNGEGSGIDIGWFR